MSLNCRISGWGVCCAVRLNAIGVLLFFEGLLHRKSCAALCVYVSLLRSDCRHALGVNVSEAVLLSVGFIFAIHWRRNRRRGACRADRFVGIDLI